MTPNGDAGAERDTVLCRGTVTINVEQCKGCGLCIPACRPGVLSMSEAVNEIGYHYPLLDVGCTGCRACHAVCPDFVFEVFKFETPVEVEVEDAEVQA